jgi:hypothetical protein
MLEPPQFQSRRRCDEHHQAGVSLALTVRKSSGNDAKPSIAGPARHGNQGPQPRITRNVPTNEWRLVVQTSFYKLMPAGGGIEKGIPQPQTP